MAKEKDNQESKRRVSRHQLAEDGDAPLQTRKSSKENSSEQKPLAPPTVSHQRDENHVSTTKAAAAKMGSLAFNAPSVQEPGAVAVSGNWYRPSNPKTQKKVKRLEKNSKDSITTNRTRKSNVNHLLPTTHRPTNREYGNSNKYSKKVTKTSTVTTCARQEHGGPQLYLHSQEPPGAVAVSLDGDMLARSRMPHEKNRSETEDDEPKQDFEEDYEQAHVNVDKAKPHTPGAVSVSFGRGEHVLSKGRLTVSECLEVERTDTGATVLENGHSNIIDQDWHAQEEPSSVYDSQGTENHHWWGSTSFKVAVGLLIIVGIALGIALPLSLSNEEPTDETTDIATRREVARTLTSLYSSSPSLDEVGSPQNLAFEWIVAKDKLSPVGSDLLVQDVETLMQRFALAVFFFATQGESSWVTSRFWLDGEVDECEWQFLSCNELGIVTSIDTGANGNRLDGFIPPEIGLLSSLESVALAQNLISQLPDELGSISNLASLYLDRNSLTGSIPSMLYKLSSIEIMTLSENSLTGTISSSISNLTSLATLDLYLNSLNGTLPTGSLGNTPIQFLGLGSNELSGNLTDIISSFPDIVFLDLSKNHFVGSIPSSIGTLKNLEDLVLSHNNISSTIPSELGRVDTLREIDMTATGLTGFIPIELGNLSDLEALVVSLNNLSGSLPQEICKLRPPGSLKTLVVDCSVECTCCSACQR